MKTRTDKLITILALLSIILTACGSNTTAPPSYENPAEGSTEISLSGTISISGAFALYPMMTVWAEEFSKQYPDVQFDIQGGGAGKGMTDTIAGAVDIGMVSRDIKAEEEAKGIFWVSVTKDAVFPIINAQNPSIEKILAQGITKATFTKIFITGEIKTWGEVVGDTTVTDEIHVFTRSDACGAAEQWVKFAGGKVQDDLKGIGVNGEPALVDTVSKDPLGIGFSNLNSIFDMQTGEPTPGIVVPPIDINEDGTVSADEIYTSKREAFNAVASGIYPMPPARFENLATKGKPTGLTREFILWILTDGQQYLESAGYVPLTTEQQAASLEKLKE